MSELEVIEVTTADEVLSVARDWFLDIGLYPVPAPGCTADVLAAMVQGDIPLGPVEKEQATRYYYDYRYCMNTRRTEG